MITIFFIIALLLGIYDIQLGPLALLCVFFLVCFAKETLLLNIALLFRDSCKLPFQASLACTSLSSSICASTIPTHILLLKILIRPRFIRDPQKRPA